MERRSRALRIVLAAGLGLAMLGIPRFAAAGITRIEITQTESPAFAGASFGDVGPYEKLIGRAFGEVDPADLQNRDIADLALAPRNSRGMVEYQTGILILRPIDPTRGNRRLFYELTNRGVILSLRALDDSPNPSTTNPTAADAGNGFLMRQGYTLLYSGWDVSAVGPFASTYPVATRRDGSPIIGPAVEELIFDSLPPAPQPITATLSYPAATLDTTQATLTVRTHYGDPQTAIPPTAWRFNDARTIQLLPEGTRFEAGRLYELAYQARDPAVAGLALAAVRDIPSFLHHAAADATGAPNPLAGRIDVVIGHGISQPARVLHDVVRLGFNRDEHGRKVFDGILNYIAGPSSGFFNYRFAQPFRTHRQHIGRWTPERVFPFANQLLFDPVTEQLGGRLVRCTLTHTCPRIFEINSSNEYWVKGGSLLHTDTRGHDLRFDPPEVRSYLFSSLPHSPAAGPGICEQSRNPLSPAAGLRALLTDLDAWITHHQEPPASRLPRRRDGTLVPSLPQSAVGFPSIPGVRYTGLMSTGDRFDFGRRFEDGILDFQTRDGAIVSPVVGSPYPVFVPRTDADGNDAAGVRFPDVAVPLATYTGYGFRASGFGGPDLCDAFGQAIPLPATRAAREASGDPRPSIEERYPTHAGYVAKVRAAAEALRDQRFLLQEDVDRFVQAAEASAIGASPTTIRAKED
ncbi:MAG TPA: alpha/beta hydrolase domain-containing protein [Kofleriaceae bacterium]|nr:alpha/beta hydrolase domain-containing protein [Kofleriaceae bacterium]